MGKLRLNVVLLVLSGLLPWDAAGFSTEPAYSLSRSFSQRAAHTNTSVEVTVTFTNASSNVVRGFWFTEQIPSELTVTTLSVTVAGRVLTNYLVESGRTGDILPGCTPWRWCFETPTNFPEANPLPAMSNGRITFLLSSTSTGTFTLPQYAWGAAQPGRTNVSFGFGGQADQPTLKFVSSMNQPLVTADYSNRAYTVTVDGVPGSIYVLSASSNLVDWTPFQTNFSPLTFTDSDLGDTPFQFFRASPTTGLAADLLVAPYSTNGYQILVSGVIGCWYLLERSPDLAAWLPLATNIVPFTYFDTNLPVLPNCYYRGRLLQVPEP